MKELKKKFAFCFAFGTICKPNKHNANAAQLEMLRIARVITVVCALGALFGCASKPPPPAPPAPDESRKMLEQAIARSMGLPATTASANAKPAGAVLGGTGLYINYAGDAKDLLRKVAAAQSLTFRVRGPQPHLPLFVIVNLQDAAFEEFLSDVGAQFGQRAVLALTNDAIEVRYRD